MNNKDIWEVFSKTGDIDAYLMYKAVSDTESRNNDYGNYKNRGTDNKKS